MQSRKSVILILLFTVLLVVSACRHQQTPQEPEVQATSEAQSEDVVNSLSGLRAKSVTKAVDETEKEKIGNSITTASVASNKFGEDVTVLLGFSRASGSAAILDAALRLKRLYSLSSVEFYIDEIAEQVQNDKIEETLDDYAFELGAEVTELGVILADIKELAESEGDVTLLNHISLMEGHYSLLKDKIIELDNSLVEVVEESITIGDFDDDGIADDVDTDWNGDGVNDDLNGDGIMTPEDFDRNGDGQISESDFDADGDGLNDFTGEAVGLFSFDEDWNDDGVEGEELEEILDGIGLQRILLERGFVDTNGDGLIDQQEYQEQVDEAELEVIPIGTIPPEGGFPLPDSDFDDDGIVDWEDSDWDGNGVEDSDEYDVNNDGLIDKNDFSNLDFDDDGIFDIEDDDINNDGIDDGLTFTYRLHQNLEYDSLVDHKYGEPSDYDGDGIADFEDDDIDNDGDLNVEDTDDDEDGVEDVVEIYALEKVIEGGTDLILGDVGIPGDYYDVVEDQHEEYDSVEELVKDNIDEYRIYMDDHPEFVGEIKSYFSEHPGDKEAYEQFLLEHAEFYDTEARYYVQQYPDVVVERPEFFIMPAVSAYYEADELPEDLQAWFDQHPETMDEYENAKEQYEEYKKDYVEVYGDDVFEDDYTELYGDDGYWGNERYDALYSEGGDYQHEDAWSESESYVGGYSSESGEDYSGYFGGEGASSEGVSSYSGGSSGFSGDSSGSDSGGYSGGGGGYGGMSGYAVYGTARLIYTGWY